MSNPITDAKYIWHVDLERIIQATYSRPDYSILDGDGAEHSNGSVLTFDVPGGNPWRDPDDLTVEQWLEGKTATLPWGATQSQPSVADICADLFVKGLLPEGYYVVHIWW